MSNKLTDKTLIGAFLADAAAEESQLSEARPTGLANADLPDHVFATSSTPFVLGGQSKPTQTKRRSSMLPPPPPREAPFAAPSASASAPRPTPVHQTRRSRVQELPEIGAIIDKYRIEELLGTGGFAAVYRATHLLLHMPVAIKMLRPSITKRNPSLVLHLRDEARIAAQVNHPNVARVYDVTHTQDITYFVMEFVDGQTLGEAIKRRGALPLHHVVRVGLDVVGGLQAALEQGIIHRDVKPANILLSKSGVAKVVDLGLARTSSPLGDAAIEDSKEGAAIIGTPSYMAPEQGLTPERVDFRADMYALGVTLYEAALGRLPFRSREGMSAMMMHRTEPVPLPEDVSPGFPKNVSGLLMTMLAKQPAQRYASYAELRAKMRAVLATLPAPVDGDSLRPKPLSNLPPR